MQEQAPKLLKSGVSASDAARLRWERQRQREADEQAQAAHSARGEVLAYRGTVEQGAIIDKLAREAKAGNVAAARELREWLAKVEVETDTSISALDRRVRQRMKARLLAEIAAEEAIVSSLAPPQRYADSQSGEATPASAGTPVAAEP